MQRNSNVAAVFGNTSVFQCDNSGLHDRRNFITPLNKIQKRETFVTSVFAVYVHSILGTGPHTNQLTSIWDSIRIGCGCNWCWQKTHSAISLVSILTTRKYSQTGALGRPGPLFLPMAFILSTGDKIDAIFRCSIL